MKVVTGLLAVSGLAGVYFVGERGLSSYAATSAALDNNYNNNNNNNNNNAAQASQHDGRRKLMDATSVHLNPSAFVYNDPVSVEAKEKVTSVPGEGHHKLMTNSKKALGDTLPSSPIAGGPNMQKQVMQAGGKYKQYAAEVDTPFNKYAKMPRKIFGCVARKTALQGMFPRWKGEYIHLQHGANLNVKHLIEHFGANEHDLLFGHLHQAQYCVHNVMEWPGKHLYFNPEPMDILSKTPRWSNMTFDADVATALKYDYLPPSDRMMVVGPHEDSEHSMQVFVGAMYFALERGVPAHIRKFANYAERPQNNRRYFMGYFQSHHVLHREEAVAHLSRAMYEAFGPEKRMHVGEGCQGHLGARGTSGSDNRLCAPATEEEAKYVEVKIHKDDFEANPRLRKGPNYLTNDRILQNYRFTVAFENCDRSGYVTEKIFNAFLSGSIPIYWGTKDVFELFNKKAFIFYNMTDPQPAIEHIKYLESHPQAYEDMLREPILRDGWDTVVKYFSLRDDIGHGSLRKKILAKMGYNPNIC